MVDFFRSAMSYLSGEGDVGGGSGGGNAFVGQTVDIGDGMKLKVKKVIAEGGYGFVFVAQDTSTGIDYALKRQIVASENIKAIKQEITFLTQLSGHPHIINFIGAASSKDPAGGSAEFLIVTELITGGELVDIVNTRPLSPRQVLRVFYETCQAIAHMHSQTPPIIHRDIKVENLLLTDKGSVKLCDFGSATTQRLTPDHSWSATQRGLTEDEIQANTTPMYRAPEMIDLYSNYPINEKGDIWALGCLLYKLCFQEHPFEDSAKLRILNANYHIPPGDNVYKEFHNIIRSCLVVDPTKRPSVDSIVAQLYPIADKFGENFDKPPKEPLISGVQSQSVSDPTESDSSGGINAASALHATSHQAQKLFGFMKGGAENLFKNIKDTSNKVISSVQNPKQKSTDITYVTSRILVMSYPFEEGGVGRPNVLKEVSAYLEGTHPSQYLVFNLSGEQYDTDQLSGQVVDYEWPNRAMPPLESLVELCRQLDSWLRADFKNVLVIHCKDGVHPSGILVVSYLLFLRALPSPSSALRLFTARRLPEGQGMDISPSDRRYLNYMMALSRPAPYKPHPHSFKLTGLNLTSVPIYNEARNGCKPFVEVFVDGERVHTSCNKENMDKLKEYTTKDGQISIPLNTTVYGNLLIIVHHIKSVPLTKRAEMGMSAVKMFKFQIHTGFLSTKMTSLTLEKNELDGSAVKKTDRFPSSFKVLLNFSVQEAVQNAGVAWQNLPHAQATPMTCFSTMEEQGDVFKLFGGSIQELQKKPPTHQTTPPVQQTTPSLEGYGQLLDEDSSEPATGNLLGDTGAAGNLFGETGGTNLADFVGYASYRTPGQSGGAESDSSSDSSGCSSSSSDSEGGDVPTSSPRQPTVSVDDDLEAFFSNPAASNIEEGNLLELGSTPPVKTASSNVSNTSSTRQTSFGNDPFAGFEWTHSTTNHPPPSTSNNSAPASNKASTSSGFDPFAPSSGGAGEDLMNLMGTTPLLPTATSAPTTMSSQTRFSGNLGATRSGMYPSSSGYSGWASFTATSTTSKHDEIPQDKRGGGGGSKAPPSSKSSDPFGDIWGQASGKSQQQTSQAPPKATPTNQQQYKPTMSHRPTYQMYGGMGGASDGARGNSGKGGVGGANSSKSGTGLRPPSRENVTRSPSPTQKFGPVPNRSKTQFNDLLDPGLFTSSAKEKEGPTSLKDMRKKVDVITDPERAKVADWAEGKEHNIRALISSLHTILWEGERRWKKVGMHELVEADQVSKYFRKACLSVHPDKVDESNANLARAIFDELNDAYELFEQSGAKSLY
ncbi:PREDICTED: cyclin-G-associated kinase [Amphimedon queenslandica]|uniref:Cyclin-G-associated kinase n=4 Tax=Amphimedon queenslandica TaxID=400682 RepID=A0AAN0J833_AMPQE|nr:PREDICTED: cyclin-G-associated kinase [Amphimedon queenslandica]|eukprot:XP_019852858.1 PREDICTED: cyclin-G-associated kinase [Amphimedon queenslandica]